MLKGRVKAKSFQSSDVLIVGIPLYAGRVPELLREYFNNIEGNNSKVIAVVYANCDYSDTMLAWITISKSRGFIPIAGSTFLGKHSYNRLVATERSDVLEVNIVTNFSKKRLCT